METGGSLGLARQPGCLDQQAPGSARDSLSTNKVEQLKKRPNVKLWALHASAYTQKKEKESLQSIHIERRPYWFTFISPNFSTLTAMETQTVTVKCGVPSSVMGSQDQLSSVAPNGSWVAI